MIALQFGPCLPVHSAWLRYAGPTDVRTSLDSTASPFAKLALAHALGVCGDIFVTVALADSIFFSVATDANAARSKVLLYLVFTMAPFAVVGCLYLFTSLQTHTMLFFLGWNIVGAAVYFLWSRRRSLLSATQV